jgi:Rha family phage regulatory protein
MAYTTRSIHPEVRIIDGEVVTNTHNMAWVFKLDHEQLLRDIEQLWCSKAFKEQNFFKVSYTDPEGVLQEMYRVKRDGFVLLARGLQGEKQEAQKQVYMECFQHQEEVLTSDDPKHKNPFLQWSQLDLMKMQASIEAERRIMNGAHY